MTMEKWYTNIIIAVPGFYCSYHNFPFQLWEHFSLSKDILKMEIRNSLNFILDFFSEVYQNQITDTAKNYMLKMEMRFGKQNEKKLIFFCIRKTNKWCAPSVFFLTAFISILCISYIRNDWSSFENKFFYGLNAIENGEATK